MFLSELFQGENEVRVNLDPGATVGVIGGKGEMGRLFSGFFERSGFRVKVGDLGTRPTTREVFESSDVVLFSVPLHLTESIIRELTPFARPNQLLLDLSSLKTGPVREMLRSPSFVVGLHPMFGGKISTFRGQTIVACPARIPRPDWLRLRDLLASGGMEVKESTPEEHDRMMSIIQVLFHMTTMLTGRVIRRMGIDLAEVLEYASPGYRVELTQVGRLFAQSPELYSAIIQGNPGTREVLSQLREGLDSYKEWFEKEELYGFVEDFERSAQYLGEFCSRAYRDSSVILEAVVKSSEGGPDGD
jgi:prephenate dehydrogenase